MKLFRALQTVALTLGLVVSHLANAAIVPSTAITYVSTPQAGGSVEFKYSIDTTGLATTFDQLTLYFDRGLYESVMIIGVPSAWNAIVVQRDLFLESDGFFDALFARTYTAGDPLIDMFTLQVQLVSGMSESEQRFELLTSDTFTVVAEGFTTRATPVPEPSSLALVLAAWLAAIGTARATAKKSRRVVASATRLCSVDQAGHRAPGEAA
jgi:hypothetical protein